LLVIHQQNALEFYEPFFDMRHCKDSSQQARASHTLPTSSAAAKNNKRSIKTNQHYYYQFLRNTTNHDGI